MRLRSSALFAVAAAALFATSLQAHFVYLVPAKDNRSIQVVFSENLEPDSEVPIQRIAGIKLSAQAKENQTVQLQHQTAKDFLKADLPENIQVVRGSVTYGLLTRPNAKPALLIYHPKALLNPRYQQNNQPEAAPVIEITPISEESKIRFQVLAHGKPATAEVVLLGPDGTTSKLPTDSDGKTKPVELKGRYAAWARQVEPKAGEHAGKKYEEIRHYATLVADAPEIPMEKQSVKKRDQLPPLPTAVSSLGAAIANGYLYVYGGHCGEPHHYDTETVLGTFQRLKIDGGTAWEKLPGGPILQGMNLVAHSGKIYRVGGMQPHNKPGTPADIHSVADVAAFDIQKGTWENLPPLPVPRSSHDVVVVGNTLYVVGGWGMAGSSGKSSFYSTALALDLAAPKPAWREIDQPFQRRALTATAVGSNLYVLGGLNAKAKTSVEVDILDTKTGKWSKGPAFPGGGRMGFSPAAATVAGQLLLNTAEGQVLRLVEGKTWEKVAQAREKRMVARLLPHGNQAILVGGANQTGNVATLEVFSLDNQGKLSAQR